MITLTTRDQDNEENSFAVCAPMLWNSLRKLYAEMQNVSDLRAN